MPPKETNELEARLRELMVELEYGYQGLRTMPADHRARLAYERAAHALGERAPWEKA